MTKGRPKVIKTREELDVAGRYFVYKLYETTDGQPMQWQLLGVSHCSKLGAGYGTNFRSLKNHLWRDWLDREHRCVVPPTTFSEPDKNTPKAAVVWR
jgi:putative SOS response-associated peptidase YedK